MYGDVETLRNHCQFIMLLAVMCAVKVIAPRTEGRVRIICGIVGVILALLSICGTCWADSIEEARMQESIREGEELKDELRRDD
jgi:hypothetical protein